MRPSHVNVSFHFLVGRTQRSERMGTLVAADLSDGRSVADFAAGHLLSSPPIFEGPGFKREQ